MLPEISFSITRWADLNTGTINLCINVFLSNTKNSHQIYKGFSNADFFSTHMRMLMNASHQNDDWTVKEHCLNTVCAESSNAAQPMQRVNSSSFYKAPLLFPLIG